MEGIVPAFIAKDWYKSFRSEDVPMQPSLIPYRNYHPLSSGLLRSSMSCMLPCNHASLVCNFHAPDELAK